MATIGSILWLVLGLGIATADAAPRLPRIQEPAPAAFIGSWHGRLSIGEQQLRIVLHFTAGDDGALGGALDSPDQGVTGIPIDHIEHETAEHIRARIDRIGGVFEGALGEDGLLTGSFKQGGASFPLSLKRTDEAPSAPARPQTPRPPFPYDTEEVSYTNAQAGITLAGTLTLPKESERVPAAILITGSGAQDRDETLFGHKPFLVLADALTRNGIAVLRVDDRGVGGSTKSDTPATSADFATDVQAGIEYLRQHLRIDADRIGLIGHSEGGLIAPMVAADSAQVAFIVMLAGPGVSGRDILLHQGEAIARAAGASEELIRQNRRAQEVVFEIMNNESLGEPELRSKLEDALWKNFGSPENAELRVQLKAEATVMSSPWMRYFVFYDPAPTLKKVRCPVLALFGDKDLQVAPSQNLEPVRKALEEGGNSDFEVKSFADLNHLFQSCETGSVEEYARIEETISPQVLEYVTEWIVRRMRSN